MGDDIVIADEAVARYYRFIMTVLLDVSINRSKSYEGVGIAEFAKSLYVEGVDLKPLPVQSLLLEGSFYYADVQILLDELSNRKFFLSKAEFVDAVSIEGISKLKRPDKLHA